jgi:restriction system protein
MRKGNFMLNIWMVRAGEGGYLVEEFAKGYVGIGWNALNDLNDLKSQDNIRKQYLIKYPAVKPGKIGNAVSMIYKFYSVVKVGDKVVTYDPGKREYLVGEITGDYIFKQGIIKDYHHIRSVRWEDQRVSRDDLSVSSRNSLGGLSTLFSLNEDVYEDLLSVLKGEKLLVNKDERIEDDKDDLEEAKEDTEVKAKELIKDKIMDLSSEDLEKLTAAILRAMGYWTRITQKGPDRGVDIFASPDGLGLVEPRIKVEVKHRSKPSMGSQAIRSFIGGLREGDRGLYMSTGGFTKEAKYEAERSNIPVTLIDLDELLSLIITYYENFDVEGYALIPLVKVYWPT